MSPLKFAILGGGPSAFYVASRLLQLLPRAENLRVHVYDRLWAPYGLVRYGVAPDHPEVKNCTHKFDEAAQDPRFSFFGNVNVSSTPSSIPHAVDVPLTSFFPFYSHLILASGCTVPRLHPALPPSTLCRPALDLVHWYTSHPSNPSPPALDKTEHVSVIGHGNVSLDVARILLSPLSHLEKHDVPESVLDVLVHSRVRHVSIVGRRGPLEASFTTKELREMMQLENAAMTPLQDDILSRGAGEKMTRQQSRLLDLLKRGSKNSPGSTEKSWSLDFFRSPTGIAELPSGLSRAARLSLAHTTLDLEKRAVPTGETSQLDTDLVVTSLGQRAEPAQEWYEPALGHLRNVSGRIVGADGKVVRNVYASGWAATGARGVLASTMLNAHALVDTILSDHSAAQGVDAGANAQTSISLPTSDALQLKGESVDLMSADPDLDMESLPIEVEEAREDGHVISYGDWKEVDAEEVRVGALKEKERERMDWKAAKAFLGRSDSSSVTGRDHFVLDSVL